MAEGSFSGTVLRYLGFVLVITGLLTLLPIIPAVLYGEYFAISSFIIASLVSLSIGVALMFGFKKGELTLGRAMVLAALAFAAMAFIGAIPFYMMADLVYGSGGASAFLNAFFESMSGFTTTGLSTLPNIEAAPSCLLMWRAFMQWIGGIGIIILFLTVLLGPGISSTYLYRGESHEERLEPSVRHTARDMVKIYLFYTGVGIVILFLLGMPLFDSFSHVFATVSTGGFSSENTSIAAYSSVWIELTLVILMMMGATSFILHNALLRRRFSDLKATIKTVEIKALIVVVVSFSAILALYFYFTGDSSPLRHGVFQAVSASTTTGFSNMSYAGMADFTKLILILLMFIGGSAGSTAGGLKIIRIMLLLAAIPWMIRKYLLPSSAVVPFKLGKKHFEDKTIIHIALYFFIYAFMIVFGTIVIASYHYPLVDSLFETTSAAATVGLSTGITSYAAPAIVKIVLIFEMWIGRLEILPVLVLLGSLFSTRRWSHFYE